MEKLLPYSESKETKVVENLNTCISNITKYKKINAFINTYEDECMEKAIQIDNRNKRTKKLEGMIVGIKDMFCYKDHPMTSSSKILEGFISRLNATVIEKLLDNDTLLIGHQNCDEFGMGSSNENSCYGPVLNPLDNSKVAGGSSGGSSAAIASNMCHISLGTDTGGSVRQPAAFCGVIGLKPTYSRISRFGVIAYASSFDTVGILSKNIMDCALALEVLAGKDEKDNTSSSLEVPSYSDLLDTEKKYKVLYISETLYHAGLQPEIRDTIHTTLKKLESQGHTVTEISFPMLDIVLPLYYILSTAEASSNLARYDGIRYGHRAKEGENYKEIVRKTRSEGFGDEVKKRILLGTSILSSANNNECYIKAQKVRRLIKNKYDELLADYDFIILPTTPTTAFELNSCKDPISMYLSDLYTVQASAIGYPAISIPMNEDKQGLPIGIQIMAKPFEEASLLAFSNYLLQM